MPVNQYIDPELGQRVLDEATPREDGCWITAGKENAYNHYGYVGGILAHRAAWVAANGRQIKPDYVIDHMCFTRLCVNPAHLRELSRRENSMRKKGDDFPLGQCKWGHPDSARVQVFWKSRAVRTDCLECRKERNRAGTERRRLARIAERGN